MADEDQQSYESALKIFQQKYSKKNIMGFSSRIINSTELPVYEDDERVEIRSYKFLLKFLELFGSSMTKFSISFGLNRHNNDAVELIHEHCAESLIDLTLHHCAGNELEDIDVPFQSLQSLTISGSFKSLDSHSFKFPAIFPELRRLSFDRFLNVENKESLYLTYPNLEHLDVHMFNGLWESDVERVLKSNPTIRSLTLSHSSEEFLRIVTETLPKLERLELSEFSKSNSQEFNEIVFENVRTFSIHTGSQELGLQNVTFTHLDELIFNAYWPYHKWRKVLYKNPELTKLTFNTLNNRYDKLHEIALYLTNLTDVTIRCDRGLIGADVLDFVKNVKGLKVLTLTDNFVEDEKTEFLLHNLYDEWNMSFINIKKPQLGFQLRRKNVDE